jgi:TPR repeat protein
MTKSIPVSDPQDTPLRCAPPAPRRLTGPLDAIHAAALRGEAAAQTAMGHCYLHGDGLKADSAEAVRWYRLAAAQGDAEAQGCLGFCCEHGIGVVRDPQTAAEWYRQAGGVRR